MTGTIIKCKICEFRRWISKSQNNLADKVGSDRIPAKTQENQVTPSSCKMANKNKPIINIMRKVCYKTIGKNCKISFKDSANVEKNNSAAAIAVEEAKGVRKSRSIATMSSRFQRILRSVFKKKAKSVNKSGGHVKCDERVIRHLEAFVEGNQSYKVRLAEEVVTGRKCKLPDSSLITVEFVRTYEVKVKREDEEMKNSAPPRTAEEAEDVGKSLSADTTEKSKIKLKVDSTTTTTDGKEYMLLASVDIDVFSLANRE